MPEMSTGKSIRGGEREREGQRKCERDKSVSDGIGHDRIRAVRQT